jgi:hypothetical protein
MDEQVNGARIERLPHSGARPTDDMPLPGRVVDAPRVRGRTGQAIDLMLWEGMTRNEAAKALGMNPKSLANAFREPRVKQYWRAGLEALAISACARNIHRLETIRDAADNMPAVQAIRMLEELTTAEGARAGLPGVRSPGLQIVILQPGATPHPQVVELQANEVQDEDTATDPVKHEPELP